MDEPRFLDYSGLPPEAAGSDKHPMVAVHYALRIWGSNSSRAPDGAADGDDQLDESGVAKFSHNRSGVSQLKAERIRKEYSCSARLPGLRAVDRRLTASFLFL